MHPRVMPCADLQVGLAKGELIKWTKGFDCAGVEGKDVVAMLKAAIDRRDDVDIDVAALLNDTTGRCDLITVARLFYS